MTFETFLDDHLDRLSAYARLLEGNRHDAEDLLADTLLKAHRLWPRISGMDHPLAYVRAMVSSHHADRHRSWFARRVRPTDDLAVFDGTDDPAPVIATRAEVEGLLRSLTPQQRAALVLRFYFDLEHTEIAAELGVAPGTARSLVSRALHAARAHSTDQEAHRER